MAACFVLFYGKNDKNIYEIYGKNDKNICEFYGKSDKSLHMSKIFSTFVPN